MMRVAFLGLGAMGSRMARSLIEAGNEVTVWNRSPAAAAALVAAGGRAADSPRVAVAGAECVFAMLRDDEASRAVWLDPEWGALAGMAAGSLAIESSTVTADWSIALGQSCAAAGVEFLEAPVVGSRPQAEARQLIHLVGGAESTLTRAAPLLAAIGAAAHHAGPVGAGAAAKLIVNALFAIQVASLAELLPLAGPRGVSPARLLEILAATPVLSLAAKAAGAGILSGNFSPLFPIDLVVKDLGYAAAMGGGIPMVAAAEARYRAAVTAGFGGEHITAVAKL